MHGVAGNNSGCCHILLCLPACSNHTIDVNVCQLASIMQLLFVFASLLKLCIGNCRKIGSTMELQQRSGSPPRGGSTPGASTARWRVRGMSLSTGTLPKTLPGYAINLTPPPSLVQLKDSVVMRVCSISRHHRHDSHGLP